VRIDAEKVASSTLSTRAILVAVRVPGSINETAAIELKAQAFDHLFVA
jgi:hypothetical protein